MATTTSPLTNIDPATLRGASRKDLVRLAKDLAALKAQAAQVGPQNDDELHKLIKDKWGVHIPRVAVDVDRGHRAPFDVIADVFFERKTAVLVVGSRDSGKTFGVQIIHALNARFKPGYEGLSAGAVDEQSKKAYSTLKDLNSKWGSEAKTTENVVASSLQSETVYKNGSKVYVLGGTKSQMNGPHSNLLHRDEAELFREDAWNEANNITRTGRTRDGRVIKAVDLITSSMKYAKGRLQRLLAEVETAKRNGTVPPYEVYKWGVAETIEPQTNCRRAPENQGKPEDQLCTCNQYSKGTWDDGSVRYLDEVCNGRFARSDGYKPLFPDVVNKFLMNSREVWEAQQESMRPAAEGLIIPYFTKERFCVMNYKFDPQNGPVFNTNDFGGTHPFCSLWFQVLTRDVVVDSYGHEDYAGDEKLFYPGEPRVVEAGSFIFFREIYKAELSDAGFRKLVQHKETVLRLLHPDYTTEERYIDPAAKAGRTEFRENDMPSIWRKGVTREIEDHIKLVQEIFGDDQIVICIDECEMLVEELEAWQRDPDTGKPIDDFNHAVDPLRYGIANVRRKQAIERKRGDSKDIPEAGSGGNAAKPVAGLNINALPGTGPARRGLDEDPFGIPMHAGPQPGPPGRIW